MPTGIRGDWQVTNPRTRIETHNEFLARTLQGSGYSRQPARETEKLVNEILNPPVRGKVRRARTDRDVARLEEELSAELGTTVQIRQGRKGSGMLVIRYISHEHLDSLLTRLTRK